MLDFICNVARREHITPHLRSLNWLKMKERPFLHLYSLVIKILGSNRPEYLREKLHFLSDSHQVNTRLKNKLAIEPQKYELFKSSFTYAAVFNISSLLMQ